MWLLAAITLTPIITLVLSLSCCQLAQVLWACIVVAVLWVIFNLMGLPYAGAATTSGSL